MEKLHILSHKLYSLRVLHKNSAVLEHAIMKRNDWEPYVPTHFIYAFFAFNTLYNINWGESASKGNLWSFSYYDKVTEHDKINSYIEFCCQDDSFLEEYKEFVVQFITAHYSADDILNELKCIEIDRRYSNGNIYRREFIDTFISACHRLLKENVLDKVTIKNIVGFIYKIRCNLFHGVKELEELNCPAQQKRLDIYSLFIVAINQMVFSCIDFLNGKDIYKDFAYMIRNLKWEGSQIAR